MRRIGAHGIGFLLGACAALGLALGGAGAAGAQPADAEAAIRPASPPAPTPAEAPIYRPPSRGKPRARVGGGVRGQLGGLPVLRALVPEHTGLTVSAQPSLFWYIDALPPEDVLLVFTLQDDRDAVPLVEAVLPRPGRAGIQRIDLGEHGVDLAPGTEYEWSVALVADAASRARDVVTFGWIDRVAAPEGLPSDASARVFASAGLWYDALAAVDDALRARPGDESARRLQEALLREVGLELSAPRGGG